MGKRERIPDHYQPKASHLLHVLFVKNLLHGQQLDDPPRPPVERRALLLGVAGVAEGDEEAALAAALGDAAELFRSCGRIPRYFGD